MNITIEKEAFDFYKEDFGFKSGDYVRLFVLYGGCSGVQQGLSLGIRLDNPVLPTTSTVVEGVTFYIEEDDLWFFDGHNLHITYEEGKESPTFNYIK
jgi:uncharacterized protein YneR